MSFTAVLDANVLWPAALRCTLVRAAIARLYRAVWTRRILEEMANALVREGRAPRERMDRTVQLMLNRVPHTLVEGYEGLIPAMLCHPKDRHVLAAAVRANAGTIVTFNGKDFPPESRQPYCIAVHTPDEFLLHLWELSPETMVRIIEEQAAALNAPQMTGRQVIEGMRNLVPHFSANVLRSGFLGDDIGEAGSLRERQASYR